VYAAFCDFMISFQEGWEIILPNLPLSDEELGGRKDAGRERGRRAKVREKGGSGWGGKGGYNSNGRRDWRHGVLLWIFSRRTRPMTRK